MRCYLLSKQLKRAKKKVSQHWNVVDVDPRFMFILSSAWQVHFNYFWGDTNREQGEPADGEDF